MDRRCFLLTSLAGAFATPRAAEAQQSRRSVRRVGWLDPGSSTGEETPGLAAFRESMRELGWVEGTNVVYESAFAEGNAERLPALAAELIARKVDVIVTGGTTAIRAARNATEAVPIVMTGGGDPVGTGLVQSLARPGGNITGVSLVGQELMYKNVDLLKQALPRVRTLALLRNAANPANPFFLQHAETAGRQLGIRVSAVDVRDPSDFDAVFARPAVDAAIMLSDFMFYPHRSRIAQLAILSRLPLMASDRTYAEAGFLLTHGFQYIERVRAAAPYVDKILRGANPGELPIEQPRRSELAINLKTAKALGLTIPPALLLRADQVIE
jgi:putative tryptophan/tyrosine transport system substrate-binding protein